MLPFKMCNDNVELTSNGRSLLNCQIKICQHLYAYSEMLESYTDTEPLLLFIKHSIKMHVYVHIRSYLLSARNTGVHHWKDTTCVKDT